MRPPAIFSARLLGWAIGVVLTAVTVFGARDEWRYTRTENFEVLSAAAEKKTRELVIKLEQFRASFITTFALRPAHEPRVTVVLFDSDRAFTPYKPTYQGKPKDVAGFFVAGADEVVIALNLSASLDEDDDPAETIFHEYVHLLVHSRGLHLPTWLNEGLAELFSTFRLNKETVEYGRPKQTYVDILNLSALMPLPRLMAVTEASPDYNEEMRAGMFYAQAWALTHFLVCGEDRTNAARLGRFFESAGLTGTGSVETFREIWGKDFDKLEQKLRAYLQGGRYFQRRGPLMLKDLAAKISVRAATDFERDSILLNLRWRVHQSGDAMLAALQLAEKNPASPRPHELLAAIALEAREFPRALERWRMAAELGSENPFALVQGARGKLYDLGIDEDFDRRLPEVEAAQLRLWLDRAMTLGPLYDDAVEILALVESRSPEFRVDAINRIQKRANALKDPNPTLLALAVIRWRARDIATAGTIAQAIVDSSLAKPHTKAAARQLQLRFAESAEAPARKVSASPRTPLPSLLEQAGRAIGQRPEPNPARSGVTFGVGADGTFADRLVGPATPEEDEIIRRLSAYQDLGNGGALESAPTDEALRKQVAEAVARKVDAAARPVFQAAPLYPFALRQANLTGEAKVRCVVDATGHPRDLVITSATHAAFGEAALVALQRWRFIPQIKNGRAVKAEFEVPFVFRLNDALR